MRGCNIRVRLTILKRVREGAGGEGRRMHRPKALCRQICIDSSLFSGKSDERTQLACVTAVKSQNDYYLEATWRR